MIQRAGIEEIYDPAIELEAENRSGSGSAGNTVDPEPNHCEGVAMDSLTYPHSLVEAFERNQLALSILSTDRDTESVTRRSSTQGSPTPLDELIELNEELSAPRYTQYEMEVESQASFSAWLGPRHARGSSENASQWLVTAQTSSPTSGRIRIGANSLSRHSGSI